MGQDGALCRLLYKYTGCVYLHHRVQTGYALHLTVLEALEACQLIIYS
jgi:hypothetical protein